MSSFDQIGLDFTETTDLDTTAKFLGAPGVPGEIREELHPTYGLRKWRLVLNESGGALVAGTGYIQTAPSSALQSKTVGASIQSGNVSVAATTLPTMAGFAQHAIGNDEWGWVLVRGIGLVLANAAIDDGDVIELAAGGEVDDTVGTGTVVGIAHEAITQDTTGLAFVHVVD